jgi:hypothetical protein
MEEVDSSGADGTSPRWRRRLLWLAVVCVVLGVVAAFALPRVAGRALEEKLESSLSGRRGVTASWASLEVDWDGTLVLREARFDLETHGLSGTADRVVLEPSVTTLLTDQPRVDDVRVDGFTVRIDAPRFARALSERGEGDASDEPVGSGRLGRMIRAILEDPPDVMMERASAELTVGDEPIGRVDLSDVELVGDDARWEVEVVGSTRITSERLPKRLRAGFDWRVRGHLAPLERTFALRLVSPDEGAPLFAHGESLLGEVELAALAIERQAQRAPAASLEGLRVRLGRAEAPLVRLQTESVGVRWVEGRPSLLAQRPRLELTPRRLGQARRIAELLRADRAALASNLAREAIGRARGDNKKAKATAAGRASLAPDPRDLRHPLVEELLEWTGRVRLEARDGALVVDLGDEERGGRITLVDELDVVLADRRIGAEGRSADGRFEAHAEFVPGQLLPRWVVVSARDVALDRLPGMPKSRTLPKRGVRGTLGGSVDFTLAMEAPPSFLFSDFAMEPLSAQFAIHWRDGFVTFDGLADEPVRDLDARFDGSLLWEPAFGRIRLADGVAVRGPITADITAAMVDFPMDTTFEFGAKVRKMPCQEAVRAVPAAILGPLQDIEIEGEAAPFLRVVYPVYEPRRAELEFGGLTEELEEPLEVTKNGETREIASEPLCSITALQMREEGRPEHITINEEVERTLEGVRAPLERKPRGYDPAELADVYWLNEPFVMEVTEGVSEEAEIFVGPGTEQYVPITELPVPVSAAAYLSEEIGFFWDRGIAPSLIERAFRLNLEKGRFVYGGSTVTQQLVKNLFLTRRKTLARKFQEMLIAFRIDEVVSKHRLLELYLNCIEFGPDVYGIGPAAQFYFQKDARELTAREGIFLAMLKPSPHMGELYRKRGRTPDYDYWTERVRILFDRYAEWEILTPSRVVEIRDHRPIRWDDEGKYIDPVPEPEPAAADGVIPEMLRMPGDPSSEDDE